LEEETSEDFERVVRDMEKARIAARLPNESSSDVRNIPADSYFWQCFFLATITNPSRRQGALAYLVRCLPKLTENVRPASEKEGPRNLSTVAESVVSPEPGLLIRCFACGLSDDQILIKRGFLDLLVSHLPLNSPILLEKVSQNDLDCLVVAAAGVVIRRDMSLNRRLYAWFLGPDPSGGMDDPDQLDTSSHQAAYFSKYGQKSLSRSILAMIRKQSPIPAERAKPFRICLSLMDHWEVGGLIVPEIFVPVLQSVEDFSQSASKDQLDEVLRSANNFFDGVESGLIWSKLLDLNLASLKDPELPESERLQKLKLAKFVLSRFNIREEDMQLYHIPIVTLAIVTELNKAIDDEAETSPVPQPVVASLLEVIDLLVDNIPDRAFGKGPMKAKTPSAVKMKEFDIMKSILSFYGDSQGNLEVAKPPLVAEELSCYLIKGLTSLFTLSLTKNVVSSEIISRIFTASLYKVSTFNGLDHSDLISTITHTVPHSKSATDSISLKKHLALTTTPSKKYVENTPHSNKTVSSITAESRALPFQLTSGVAEVLIALQSSQASGSPFISQDQLPIIIDGLIRALWVYLDPLKPKYHVETVRCIWRLQTIAPSRKLIESSITAMINESKMEGDAAL
jgi:hypothetical protein